MRKTAIIMLILISSLLLLGCSSKQDQFQDMPERNFDRDRPQMNLSDEERQNMLMPPEMSEEMQQKMIEACQDKNEGNECVLEDPRGETTGTCKISEDSLVCTIERPMGRRME